MVELFKNDYMVDLIDDLDYLLINVNSLDDTELNVLNDDLLAFRNNIKEYIAAIDVRNKAKLPVDNNMSPKEYVANRFCDLARELLMDDLPCEERRMLVELEQKFRNDYLMG